jgi:hypothetical protein
MATRGSTRQVHSRKRVLIARYTAPVSPNQSETLGYGSNRPRTDSGISALSVIAPPTGRLARIEPASRVLERGNCCIVMKHTRLPSRCFRTVCRCWAETDGNSRPTIDRVDDEIGSVDLSPNLSPVESNSGALRDRKRHHMERSPTRAHSEPVAGRAPAPDPSASSSRPRCAMIGPPVIASSAARGTRNGRPNAIMGSPSAPLVSRHL